MPIHRPNPHLTADFINSILTYHSRVLGLRFFLNMIFLHFRIRFLLPLVLCLAGLLSLQSAWAQAYGLDNLQPIGKFLDGQLPSTTPSGGEQPPALLSQVGAFTSMANLTPRAGLIPFKVNSPLWTDGAVKQRWMAIPNDGVADTAAEQITFSEAGAWTFPKGAVFVKEFDLPVNDGNPAVLRRMETRFLVHGDDDVYYGITYKWRPDGLEADLLPDGDSLAVSIATTSGGTRSQTWTFPSRADCRTCHNAGAGRVLGAKTVQLNGLLTYPLTGRSDNQLRTLNHLNLFSPALAESAIANYAKEVPMTETTATLEHRVRSYLDANCSHCHYPGNPANLSAGFDARLSTPLAQQNIINGSVLYDLGLPNARIIAPQATGSSVMHLRLSVNGLHQMPPIGRNTVDSLALSTFVSWINGLPIVPPPTTNQSPVAQNDEISTLLNASINIAVLANDTDPDGDALTATAPTTPSSGSVAAAAGNRYLFTPATGFTGTATFQYTALDGRGGSATATVTVRVLSPASSNSTAFFDGTSRLSAPSSTSGVAMGVADMNADGLDDIVHLQNARQLRIEYQPTTGTAFTGIAVGTATAGNQWTLCLGDADNNGYPDIMVGGYYDGLKYYRANSNGTSYGLTTLTPPSIFAQATGFVDIDRDGWLDVFACHDDGESAKFRNTGDGTLLADATLIDARTLVASDNSGNYGIVWTDYDNDGDIDLYLSKCRLGASSATDPRRINQLFRNNGNGTFTDVASQAGLAFGEQSWASDFADIDNDGDMDCYVGNHGAMSYLMLNSGNGTFSNITVAAGMSSVNFRVIQTIFRDFNNDGYVDLLLTGEQQQLWINNRNNTFTLLPNPFTSLVMESAAVGDLNADGSTDIYAGYAAIYNTPTTRPDALFLAQPNGNNFLSVRLKGVASNATASGARLELYGPWGQQVREVRTGEGYGVSHSFTQIFGMGNTATATRLRVRWPNGSVDDAYNVTANRFLTLREGSTAAPNLVSPGNLANARGTAVDLTLTASDPTGDALTFTATGLPTGLSINVNTGRITGSVASTALSSYTTVLSVTDGWSTVSRSITWTVTGLSAPSVALSTASSTVTGAFDVTTTFSAAVTGLAASAYVVTNGSIASLSGSGAIYLARITPSAAGVVTISLPANAAAGNTASNALPVTYAPADTTRPSVTLSTPATTVNGAFTVTATFSENVSGLSLGELSVTNGTAAAPSGTGNIYTFTVTPSGYGSIGVQLPANVVNDAAGNLNSASNTLSVTWPQPNRAPIVTTPSNQSTTRGTATSLAMLGSDPDGQALTWTASGLPLGLGIAAGTGVISGTVNASAAASNAVRVTASDGSLSATVNFTWATPAAVVAGNGLRAEYFNGLDPNTGTLLLTRTDATINFDWGAGSPDPLVPVDYFSARWTGFLTASYNETHTFWVPSDNGVRIWINGTLVLDKWTPTDISGWHTFTVPFTAGVAVPFKVEYSELYGGASIIVYWYSATQAWEAIATSHLTTASAVNHAPTLAMPATQSSVRSRSASLAMQGNDVDGNPLTYSASGLPLGLTISTSTGVISGTVASTAAASYTVNVIVSDGSLTAMVSFIWQTTAPPTNRAPSITNPGPQSSVRGSIAMLSGTASDPDGEALTWSATGLPAGLSLNASTGMVSGTVFSTAATSYGTTLTVTDPGGLAASASFTWTTTDAPTHGLRAEYFNGLTPGVGTPLLVRTDATIQFDWGAGSPDPLVPVDYFSARWTGTLTAPFTETYTFWVPSDNGVRIWIDNALVLDKWTPTDISGWHTFTVPLTAGVAVPIKVEYAELYGGATITVYWYSAQQAWEAVGTANLTPAAAALSSASASALRMVARTQALSAIPQVGASFVFTCPSLMDADTALMVEQSADLRHWTTTNFPASVTPNGNGTDTVRLIIPTPNPAAGLCNCFFRVRLLATQ